MVVGVSVTSSPVGRPPQRASYGAALIRTGSTVPLFLVASIITAVVYFASVNVLDAVLPAPWIAVLLGLSITLVLWLLLSFFARGWTTFDRANALISSRLKSRLLSLSAQFVSWRWNGKDRNDQTDFKQAQAYFDSIEDIFKTGRSMWVLGTGYLEIGQLLDRAEETMIEFAPVSEVIAQANLVELYLEGSAIGQREKLLNILRTAVQELNLPLSVAPPQEGPRLGLRSVKQVLNSYRHDLWEALVRMRNQLLSVTFIIALFTYVLLCFAVLSGVPTVAMMSITIFYFLGAASGFFSRLSTESRANRLGDDYGVSMARIVLTPLMSGLSAIAGVLVVAMSLSLLRSPLRLVSVYDATSALNVLAAAVFGLLPNIFANTLLRRSSRYVALLQSTEAMASDTEEFQGAKTWLEQLSGSAFAQARQWSRTGAGLAIFGFLLVVGGVIAIFAGHTVPGLIVALAGVVPEIIVVFSLQQARKSEKLADETMEKDLREEIL